MLNMDATIPDSTTPVVPNKDIIALFIPFTADEFTSPKQTAQAYKISNIITDLKYLHLYECARSVLP